MSSFRSWTLRIRTATRTRMTTRLALALELITHRPTRAAHAAGVVASVQQGAGAGTSGPLVTATKSVDAATSMDAQSSSLNAPAPRNVWANLTRTTNPRPANVMRDHPHARPRGTSAGMTTKFSKHVALRTGITQKVPYRSVLTRSATPVSGHANTRLTRDVR